MDAVTFAKAVSDEVKRAEAKHGTEQWGRHEFYGILAEEVDEVLDNIKANESQKSLEKEIIQVAAVCLRYLQTRDRYREPKSAELSPLGHLLLRR